MVGKRVGFAPGVYDLFHVGHLNILREARAHCDYLIAGVTSDDMVVRLKGRPPVVPLVERLEIVKSIRFVDEAIVESLFDKLETWKCVGFDVIFKGDDWRGTDVWTTYENRFGKVGVEVVYFPYTVHTSSTLLRSALNLLTSSSPSSEPVPAPAAVGVGGSGQLPEPLHKEGGHEEHVSNEQRAVKAEEQILAAKE